jgi:bacillithiol biosynthesis deacetylase BshB1
VENPLKLDLLAFGAHPDDVEIAIGGTLAKHIHLNYNAGVVDLTRGELGSHGDAEIRAQEADKSAKVLKLSVRENLNLPDGFVDNSPANRMKVIEAIRRFRPQVILLPYEEDRHPDHKACGTLVRECCFLSGLIKLKTAFPPHKPVQIFHYFLAWEFKFSFIVDITQDFAVKMEAINCFTSQFINIKDDNLSGALLSRADFLEFIENRARYYGNRIGVKYGEPFYSPGILQTDDLLKLKTGPFTI